MKNTCYLCANKELSIIEKIDAKPVVEVDYKIPVDLYYREIYQCNSCKVYNNFHDLINDDFYKGFYNNSITSKTFVERFERIINIPKEKSDNKNRVERVLNFLATRVNNIENQSVLDVGSGTCVFLYEIKKKVLKVTSIDPDKQSIEHALTNVKVDAAHCGSLADFDSKETYDLICFNKVLEHVKNPIENIKESLKYMSKESILYIEMPEGDRIVQNNQISSRAEFAVEHYTIYNEDSMKKIAELCELKVLSLETLTDPSGKNTIYAFYKKK